MTNWSRMDLDPALGVAAVGAVVGLLAASWVGWQHRRRSPATAGQRWVAWQRALTMLTLFLTFDLLVFGAFTRLTDSGLGCPDWPGCYGEIHPGAADAHIAQAHAALPTGPVSAPKAWIEMVHRYLATGVGALLTGLMVLAWCGRGRSGLMSPWWPTWAFLWVCGQGAFGAFTVTLRLQPIVVTGHLLGAMIGVGLLTWQVQTASWAPAPLSVAQAPAWRRAATGVLAVLVVQLALGAWVSSNYAVLACGDFPTCQGQWWPEMDAATGFRLLRPLGEDGQGGYISLAALTAIHMAHRGMAVVVVCALLALAWRLRGQPDGRPHAQWLLGLCVAQVGTGLSNVVLGWPLMAALAHTLGAALLVWRLVMLLAATRPAAVEAGGVALAREPRLSARPVSVSV